MATLQKAKAEDFDLRVLSDPEQMAMLREAERSKAKTLLRRARMFGVLAAYAAIALEGAPYRRQNILGLRHTGPRKTINLHLSGSQPHAIIKFPNEELRMGDFSRTVGRSWRPLRSKSAMMATTDRKS